MEITGTNNLWKDYDLTTLPFNKSELSDKTENGIHVKELYFDGFTTIDGRVRAYLKLLENPDAKGIILYLSDCDGDDDDFTLNALYEMGYSVAALDYLGERESSSRFTLYPKSIPQCNCYGVRKFQALNDALCSKWYIWTCIARKCIKLLQKICPDKKIFALGKGIGGSTVYKLASFDDGLTAAATLLNIIPDITGSGNPYIVYRAALDNAAYAPITKVPLFMTVASNAKDESLDEMSELAENTRSLKSFRILERAFSDSINVVFPQLKDFFDSYATETAKPFKIKVSTANSEGKLYLHINIDGEEIEVSKVNVYAAFCVTNPAYRNWANIAPVKLGNNEYLANITVLQADKPLYAFVNVTTNDGRITSSKLVSIMPKSLGLQSQTIKYRRVIYDSSMGKDVWTARNGGIIETKNGPYELVGVTSTSNSLISFKPGDVLYRTDSDSILQIIISGKQQTITVELSDENDLYASRFELPGGDNWHKITLSLHDFKGANPLTDWNKIKILEFKATEEIIISSILWV